MVPKPADIPPPPPAPQAQAPTTPQADASAATQELLRQSIAAKDNAMALLTSVQGVVATASNAVREQMQARPYVTMGAAAGAGYVLAGGLASSLSRRIVSAGTKAGVAFVTGVVMKKIKDAAEGAMGAADAPAPAAE